jgi:hypothetical protein
MIVYKKWIERSHGGLRRKNCDGWFLLGFIPLYVRKTDVPF